MESLEHHVKDIINQVTERCRISWCGPLPSQLQSAVNHLIEQSSQVMAGVSDYRDAMVVDLRAMCLVIETALSASTHREKNARLRGCVELIGATIDRHSRERFDFQDSFFRLSGGFLRDNVTSQLLRDRCDLTRRVEELTKEVEELRRAPQVNSDIGALA